MSLSSQVTSNTGCGTGKTSWQEIRNDPVQLEALLCREAIIRCEGNRCHTGVVQAIDPISKSIIVAEVDPQSGAVVNLVLCMGPSVEDVLVGDGLSKHAAQVQRLLKQHDTRELSAAELNALRDHLLSYLKAHQLPVEVDPQDGETLRIAKIAHIASPYTINHVYCQNEIIMERITKLVKEMPPLPAPSADATLEAVS